MMNILVERKIQFRQKVKLQNPDKNVIETVEREKQLETGDLLN